MKVSLSVNMGDAFVYVQQWANGLPFQVRLEDDEGDGLSTLAEGKTLEQAAARLHYRIVQLKLLHAAMLAEVGREMTGAENDKELPF